MHTRNSAYQLHQEGLSGQISEGFGADLVVLDRDLLDVPLEEGLEDEGRADRLRR